MVSINNAINNTVGATNSGVTNTFTITNPSNTAGSQARELIVVGGTSSGNPFTTYTITGSQSYSIGADNSAAQRFRISNGADLATNTILQYDPPTGGHYDIFSRVIIQTPSDGGAGATTLFSVQNPDNTNTASNATIQALTGGTSGGDATFQSADGVTDIWTWGLQHATSGKFKLSASGVLGTNDVLTSDKTNIWVNGVSFNAGAAVLSTYLTNTFSPVLAFGGASTGITYSTQYGRYIQIGTCIIFSVKIVLTSKGSAVGTASITGLPITSGPVDVGGSCTGHNLTLDVGYTQTSCLINAAATTVLLLESGSGKGLTPLSNVMFANDSQLYVQGTYYSS